MDLQKCNYLFGYLTSCELEDQWNCSHDRLRLGIKTFSNTSFKGKQIVISESTKRDYTQRLSIEQQQIQHSLLHPPQPSKKSVKRKRIVHAPVMAPIEDGADLKDKKGWERGRFGRVIATFQYREPVTRRLHCVDPTRYKNNLWKWDGLQASSKSVKDLTWEGSDETALEVESKRKERHQKALDSVQEFVWLRDPIFSRSSLKTSSRSASGDHRKQRTDEPTSLFEGLDRGVEEESDEEAMRLEKQRMLQLSRQFGSDNEDAEEENARTTVQNGIVEFEMDEGYEDPVESPLEPDQPTPAPAKDQSKLDIMEETDEESDADDLFASLREEDNGGIEEFPEDSVVSEEQAVQEPMEESKKVEALELEDDNLFDSLPNDLVEPEDSMDISPEESDLVDTEEKVQEHVETETIESIHDEDDSEAADNDPSVIEQDLKTDAPQEIEDKIEPSNKTALLDSPITGSNYQVNANLRSLVFGKDESTLFSFGTASEEETKEESGGLFSFTGGASTVADETQQVTRTVDPAVIEEQLRKRRLEEEAREREILQSLSSSKLFFLHTNASQRLQERSNFDPSVSYCRKESLDQIYARWERVKGDLTESYKKVHKNATRRRSKMTIGNKRTPR